MKITDLGEDQWGKAILTQCINNQKYLKTKYKYVCVTLLNVSVSSSVLACRTSGIKFNGKCLSGEWWKPLLTLNLFVFFLFGWGGGLVWFFWWWWVPHKGNECHIRQCGNLSLKPPQWYAPSPSPGKWAALYCITCRFCVLYHLRACQAWQNF